jgi:hypothetical protein
MERHGWCRGWRENALCCLSHKQAVVRERYFTWIVTTAGASRPVSISTPRPRRSWRDAVLELYPMIRELYTHKRASSGTLVIVWNDKICETQEQAIKLFDKAIEIAEARRL